MKRTFLLVLALGFAAPAAAQQPAAAPAPAAPSPIDRTRDRGDGIPTSMFGTYIRKGEFLFYPFFEYYRDDDYEYEPFELGFGADTTELFGRYRAKEGLIFLGYGFSENVALEIEAAVISATLDKSPLDVSSMPAQLKESGLGDVEAQIRWRWRRETDTRPELFSYFETVFPFQKDKVLIGTQHWEFKLGVGVVRGLRWGTITARLAAEYADGAFEPGEYALEYLRRVNNRLRLFAGIEGTQDEVEFITEAQIFLSRSVYLRLNNAIGVTSKATDWAPEIGIMFSIR